MHVTSHTFAARFADWLRAESLTTRAAAARIGISHDAVAKWAHGRTPHRLARPHIARAMGLDLEVIDSLIDGSHAAQPTDDGAA